MTAVISGGRVRMAATTSRAHRAGGLKVGARTRRGPGLVRAGAATAVVRGGRVRALLVADRALLRNRSALSRAIGQVR